MKITIELPDKLFAAAKAIAVQRRTTLKAMMEHAVRREIALEEPPAGNETIDVNEHGFPVLRKRRAEKVTSEMVYQMLDEGG
jgi:hypothetical protein